MGLWRHILRTWSNHPITLTVHVNISMEQRGSRMGDVIGAFISTSTDW